MSTQKITIGPSLVALTVPDLLKDAAEQWLNGIVPGGFEFVAQLATPLDPTRRVAWFAGANVDDDTMKLIRADADRFSVGFLVLERYEGIDTKVTADMTLKIVTNRTSYLGALGLVPRELPE